MSKAKYLMGLVLGLLFIATHAAAQTAEVVEPYLLSPGDRLEVTVLEDPELNRQVLVLPDGKISLPIVGTLNAGGRSPEQLMRIIRGRLAGNFIEPPNVTVSVISLDEELEEDEEEDLLSVYVLGEVNRPGRYEYDPEKPINVLQALTFAGGPGVFAARQRIQVREVVETIETLRLFDYDAAEDGHLASDKDLAALADGAIIVVPERGLFE
ncbi:polysaccharide export protein [Rhodobacteraceae bacterium NNCM2]|nr:polysaccharide export protein [Coraliihabitans acroporae]